MKGFLVGVVLLVATLVVFAQGSPMLYKKNDNDKYEPGESNNHNFSCEM